MIPVTKTFFPPLEIYNNYLNRIWKNQWLTNRGELVLELENNLRKFLNISNVILTTNGTLPIQIALKILGAQGDIITTPFSYVATTSSIMWENCNPVFVDIHPKFLTIDESKIEDAITPKTTAILATHVFGNPCNVEIIQKIAKRHDLKVIYDAAHCFGVNYKNKSIFDYGDVSTVSLHATKIFHSGEGGAIFCNDKALNEKLFYSHNFGHDGPIKFHGLGINAKMSELQAAMGLAVLPYFGEIKAARKKIVDFYMEHLDFNKISTLRLREETEWNYSYFPIIFSNELDLLRTVEKLNAIEVFPRRYFYPSLNTLEFVKSVDMPISESISSRIICLPLYSSLEIECLNDITNIINQNS